MNANHTFQIPDLTGRAFVAIPLGVVGLLGNILLFISLVRPGSQLNQLRNRTLTLLAFADMICCLNTVQFDIETLMPSQHWKSNLNCLIKKTHAIWITDLEYMMMWVIAVDRAMVIKFSMTYDHSTKIACFRWFLIAISFAYATTFTAYAWLYVRDDLLVPICNLVTATQPVIHTLTPYRSIIQLTVVVTHAVTYCMSRRLSQDAAAKRIQQSILLIAVVYILSAISTIVIYVIVQVIQPSEEDTFVVLTWVSVIARINFGANSFILALRSEQFRCEYVKTMHAVKGVLCRNKHTSNPITVHPIGESKL